MTDGFVISAECNLAEAVSYKISTILTDNGRHFTNPKVAFRRHLSNAVGVARDVERRPTRPVYPSPHGKVEGKTAPLGTPRSSASAATITLDARVCEQWTQDPECYRSDPLHQTPVQEVSSAPSHVLGGNEMAPGSDEGACLRINLDSRQAAAPYCAAA